MELDRLKLFVAIVEEGSLTGAAKRHHVTQPAVSRSLKLLEEGLGVELFERVGRGLQITPAGRALLPRAHEVLQRIETVEREVQIAARHQLFNLRLGSTDSVATYLLPEVVSPLRASYPELALQWTSGRTTELMHQLEQGHLDAAIVVEKHPPVDRHVRHLGACHMGYYGRREVFPELARVDEFEQLEGLPLIVLQSDVSVPTLIGEHTASFARVESLAASKELVLGGFGVGALLDFMLNAPEHQLLARAPLGHEPDLGVFLVVGTHFVSEREQELTAFVGDTLEAALTRRQHTSQ